MAASTRPRLRVYRGADAPFVEELARRAFAEYSRRAAVAGARAAPHAGVVTLVAVVGEAPAGFATVAVHAGGRQVIASLDAIAVEPEHRGRGVGKVLLAGAERKAKAAGATELRLVTAEANLAALDLFLRSGFEINARLGRYYERGQNAVRMRKTLAP
ncbi:MAG TPA: GNAT family N-acetyltransferase [Polyangiaceae bacterium]